MRKYQQNKLGGSVMMLSNGGEIEKEGDLWVTEMFCVLIVVVVISLVCTSVKIHSIVHFKLMQFITY